MNRSRTPAARSGARPRGRVSGRLAVAGLLLGASASACGGGGGGAASGTTAPGWASASARPVNAKVTDAGGKPLLDVAGTTITSRLGGTERTITASGSGYAIGGRTVAVPKPSADGVKLKDPAGRTLWRAKFDADKVKVRRGEDDERYALRREPDGRVKVKQGGTEIGVVRPAGSGSKVETAAGATLARAPATRPGNGLAVLLCAEIPPDLRALLAAELLARP